MTETLITNHSHHVVVVPAKVAPLYEKKQLERVEPPDGGGRAYLVMISAFLCNGILFGIINTYSIIYMSLQKQLKDSGVENASSYACKLIRNRKSFHENVNQREKIKFRPHTSILFVSLRDAQQQKREEADVIKNEEMYFTRRHLFGFSVRKFPFLYLQSRSSFSFHLTTDSSLSCGANVYCSLTRKARINEFLIIFLCLSLSGQVEWWVISARDYPPRWLIRNYFRCCWPSIDFFLSLRSFLSFLSVTR